MMDLNSLSPEEFGIGAPAPTTIQPMAILDPQAGAGLADVPPLPMTSPMAAPPQEAPVSAPTEPAMGGGLALPPAPPIPTRQKPTTPARPPKPLTPTQQRDAAVQQQIASYDEAKVLAGQEAGVNAATSRKLEEQQWQNIQEQEGKVLREERFAQDVDDHLQREMGTLDKDLQQIKEQKINPNQVFQNMGIAGQMMAALSVGMASVGDAILGNKSNSALDRINQMIDRDVAVQERNLANKKDAAKMKDSLIGRMAEQGASKLDRMQRMRIAGYEMGKQKLAAIAQSGDSEMQRVNAGKAINALSQEQAKLQQSYQERKIAEARAAAAAGAAAKKLEWERAKDIREQDLKEKQFKFQAQEAGYGIDEKGNPIPGWGGSFKNRELAIKEAEAGIGPNGATSGGKVAREGAEQISKAFDSANVPQASASIKATRELLDKYKDSDSIPGVTGQIMSRQPNMTMNNEEAQNNQVVDNLVAQYSRLMSGAGMPEAEAERYKNIIRGSRSKADLEHGLDLVDDAVKERALSIKGGYGDAAYERYRSQGGSVEGLTPAEIEADRIRKLALKGKKGK